MIALIIGYSVGEFVMSGWINRSIESPRVQFADSSNGNDGNASKEKGRHKNNRRITPEATFQHYSVVGRAANLPSQQMYTAESVAASDGNDYIELASVGNYPGKLQSGNALDSNLQALSSSGSPENNYYELNIVHPDPDTYLNPAHTLDFEQPMSSESSAENIYDNPYQT